LSLYSALYAGVSGLSAQSSALAGVADNITNVNTVGYKGIDTQFGTLVTSGTARGAYAAGGVTAAPHAMISKQGLLSTSSSATDIAIDGNGFFVVRDSADPSAQPVYTRAGSFSPDKQGYLRNASGYYLQGWPLDANGNYNNNGNLSALTPIRLNDLTGTALPTNKIAMRANLSATAPTYAGPPAYTPGKMADGTIQPTFSRSFDVSDAQGTSHRVTMAYLKTGANTWAAETYVEPATDVAAPTPATGLLASGNVKFNADGSLDIAGSTAALFSPLSVTWANGAASVPINLSLGTQNGVDGLTQFDGTSAVLSSSVNGGKLGTISAIDISKDGVVSAKFEDGTSLAVFQLPIATFQNPDGLQRLPGNAYGLSPDSGAVSINAPGAAGTGAVASYSLEASNVDLAQEFTNMIKFQRAYSASSKIITTVDEMLQEVNNLKR
jgi:flagellar hook protein FlgE